MTEKDLSIKDLLSFFSLIHLILWKTEKKNERQQTMWLNRYRYILDKFEKKQKDRVNQHETPCSW